MEKSETTYSPFGADACSVVKLREALIQAAQGAEPEVAHGPRHEALMRQVDSAAAALLERCSAPLLHYCDSLARGTSSLRNHADGADIAQDAWTKVVRYLQSERGAKVKDDTHFFRLLRAAAKSRFLDLCAQTVASTDAAPSLLHERTGASPVDALSPLGSDRAVELIELLFTDEDGFRKSCRTPIRRRLMHYQAFVLYQLGQFLFSQGMDRAGDNSPRSSPIMIRLMRQYAETLGIPAGHWRTVEDAVIRFVSAGEALSTPDKPLVDVVNRLYGSGIKLGNNISVLRHEMSGFLSG